MCTLLIPLSPSTARAAFITEGEVLPADPSTWTSSTRGYVGKTTTGALTVDDGSDLLSYSGYLGFEGGATGTVTVDGAGSTWTNGRDLYIGYQGMSSGALNILNNSVVSNAGATYVGYLTDSEGIINFGSSGGTLSTRSLLASPSQLMGIGTINAQGLVSDLDLVFDATHGSKRTITLNSLPGQNISINLDMTGNPNSNGDLGVGWNGSGSLTIQDGVTVISNHGYIGYKGPSTGVATVDGAGSKWTNNSSLFIGIYGSGTLNIINGGNVTCNSGSNLGAYSGSSKGTITVDGAGSTLISGALFVGGSGTGTLNITNGGSVSNTSGYIGFLPGSMGTVTVDGSGSTWTNSGDLYISYDGISSGTINILNNSAVSIAGATYVGYNPGAIGTINFGTNGGTLTTQTLIAEPSQLMGNGVINTHALVSDIDLVFDATHSQNQTITLNKLPGQNVSIHLDMTSNPGGNIYLGAGWNGAGTLTIKDSIAINSYYGFLGYQSGSTGTATIADAGSKWTNTSSIYVGYSGNGTLNINNGGSVSSATGYLGYSSGSTGTATVDGSGSNWTSPLYVGYDGNGTLNITNGGSVNSAVSYLGFSSGTTGTVTVDGSGSKWTISGGLYIGGNFGTGSGTLNITNGGSVSNFGGYLGSSSGSMGTVTVDGAGSTWTNNYDLYVGDSGNGSLSITNGGSVSVAYDTYVGRNAGSTGTINFGTNGGTLTTHQTLFAAPSQLMGNGVINTHGLVSDIDLVFDATHGQNQIVILNKLPGQNISVNLDMTDNSFYHEVSLGAGWFGTGSLSIREGVTIKSDYGYLGYHSGSTGSATVDGAGSTWANREIYVGYSGSGTLNIINGGVVSTTLTYVSYNTGSTGTINFGTSGGTLKTDVLHASPSQLMGTGTINARGLVSDIDLLFDATHGLQQTILFNSLPGQNITINLDLISSQTRGLGAGWQDTGSLRIKDGVTVSSCIGLIGFKTGSTGAAVVDGPGSAWTMDDLVVGILGSGSLNITNGGSVSCIGFGTRLSYIGASSGSMGTVTMDGADSTWINDDLYIGYQGTGSVTQNGGTNSVAGRLQLGDSRGSGTYNLNGGTLILKSINKGSGTAQFNFGSGTLQASGNFNTLLPMTLTGESDSAQVDTAGYSVGFSGVLSGTGGLNKLGAGTLTLSAKNTYAGETDVNAGTLMVNGALKTDGITVVNHSGVLGGTGTVGQVVVNSGGHIAPGNSAGAINLAGNLTLNSGALLDFDLAAPAASDKVSMPASTLYLNNQEFGDFTFHPLGGFGVGTYLLIDAGMIQGNLGSNLNGIIDGLPARMSISGNDLVLTVVPEPGVWALLATACLGLLAFFQRRRRLGNKTTRIG